MFGAGHVCAVQTCIAGCLQHPWLLPSAGQSCPCTPGVTISNASSDREGPLRDRIAPGLRTSAPHPDVLSVCGPGKFLELT